MRGVCEDKRLMVDVYGPGGGRRSSSCTTRGARDDRCRSMLKNDSAEDLKAWQGKSERRSIRPGRVAQQRPESEAEIGYSVLVAIPVTAPVAHFISFELSRISVSHRGPLAVFRHAAVIAMLRIETVVHMAMEIR